VTIGDATLGEIIGRHLDGDPVTGQYTDTIPAELAGQVGEHNPFLVDLDAEEAAGEFLHHGPSHLNTIFLAHLPPVAIVRQPPEWAAQPRLSIA
jgi:hypothetical protein